MATTQDRNRHRTPTGSRDRYTPGQAFLETLRGQTSDPEILKAAADAENTMAKRRKHRGK